MQTSDLLSSPRIVYMMVQDPEVSKSTRAAPIFLVFLSLTLLARLLYYDLGYPKTSLVGQENIIIHLLKKRQSPS